MVKIKDWVQAARLRTLPLAFASIFLGTLLAAGQGHFKLDVFVLALLTTLSLQILANFANDLGDTLHGADHAERKGPMRAVQAGLISASQMRAGTVFMSILSFGFGLGLLWAAFTSWAQFGIFLGLGLLSIAGAVLYTNGKRPYGYMGLGDISVLLFFGLIGVLGTYALYSGPWFSLLWLPAISAGLLAVGVLNVNNLRDIYSDTIAGKYSIPVRLGFKKGKLYHTALIAGALTCNFVFTWLVPEASPFKYLWVLPALGLVKHARTIQNLQEPGEADAQLKVLALLSLASDLFLGGGYLLAQVFPAGLSF
jgi:1,4-dihydroxy-2-naphthoate octaprenyltransferase